MTDQQLQSNLKQMAEFDGLIIPESDKFCQWPRFYMPDKNVKIKQGVLVGYFHNLKYNTSSDWLLPVFYKFINLKLEGILLEAHQIYCDDIGRALMRSNALSEGITRAFELLSEGIEWYNSLKK